MANSRPRTNCFLLCFAAFLNLIILSHAHSSTDDHNLPENHNVALFIFGDSLFDAGNNNYINTTVDFRANFWPYGETFFNYPTGRFCDGRLIPDFVAQFAGLPIIPPYLKPGNHKFTDGANFASAGAGALAESHQGFVVDLETQIKYFKKVEKSLKQQVLVDDAEANKLLSKAVYLFSVGGNDYLTRNSSTSDEDYVSMVLGNLTVALKEIYKSGGRKFGFVNIMPFGCSPYMFAQNGGSCVNNFTAIAKLHNERLAQTLKNLEKQLPGFKFAYYDFFESFTQRLNNPSKYGFKDAKTACCGSGPYRGSFSCGGKRGGIKEFDLCKDVGQHLFFDSYQPSEKAYHQFADLMWGGTADIVWPYNLKTLFKP